MHWTSTHDHQGVLCKRPLPAAPLIANVIDVIHASLVAEALDRPPRLYSVSKRSLSVQSKAHHIAPRSGKLVSAVVLCWRKSGLPAWKPTEYRKTLPRG